jgi:hypothetical protein
MTTKTIEGLQQQIEQLVREHLVAQQRAVTAAVQRAFASETAPTRAPAARTSTQRRRGAGEMSELQERLYQAVRANPGETITTIAAHVGQPPRALNRPMVHLKREGRVRSAGQRHLTRYFPMLATKSS